MKSIDKAILEIIKTNPDLQARHEILVSINGISEVTAAAILTMMPELGHLDGKQAASLAGLAPVTRQSGRWHGKAVIQGGRAALRQALYMPAVVACRFNPDLKAKYDQLIRPTHKRRETAQTCNHRHNAQAHRPRQRADP